MLFSNQELHGDEGVSVVGGGHHKIETVLQLLMHRKVSFKTTEKGPFNLA